MSGPDDTSTDAPKYSQETSAATLETILWQASEARLRKSAMYRFASQVGQTGPSPTEMQHQLHNWSLREPAAFWSAVASFTNVKWSEQPQRVYEPPPQGKTFAAAKWFVGGRLNYAENLLAGSLAMGSVSTDSVSTDSVSTDSVSTDSVLAAEGDKETIVAYREGCPVRRITKARLVEEVAKLSRRPTPSGYRTRRPGCGDSYQWTRSDHRDVGNSESWRSLGVVFSRFWS